MSFTRENVKSWWLEGRFEGPYYFHLNEIVTSSRPHILSISQVELEDPEHAPVVIWKGPILTLEELTPEEQAIANRDHRILLAYLDNNYLVTRCDPYYFKDTKPNLLLDILGEIDLDDQELEVIDFTHPLSRALEVWEL